MKEVESKEHKKDKSRIDFEYQNLLNKREELFGQNHSS